MGRPLYLTSMCPHNDTVDKSVAKGRSKGGEAPDLFRGLYLHSICPGLFLIIGFA